MTEMILRVLLPNSPDLDQSAPCLLLGALLHSTHRGQQVLTAIVVSVKPFELLPPLSQVKQQLANSRVSLPTASAQAKLAVLGAWQLGLHQSATPGKQHPPGSEDHVWLVLQGKQCLQQALGHTSWHGHTWTGPTCNLQQSSLPPGTDLVQLFLYNVPAQQSGCAHVQLPLPPPAPQLPWMSRAPGGVTLASIMHMLQEAHATLQQQQQQQPPKAVLDGHQQQQQQQQQQEGRTRLQRQRARQQTQQAHSSALQHHTQQGWAQLAAVQAAADSRKRTTLLAQKWAAVRAYAEQLVQLLANFSPAVLTAQSSPQSTAAPPSSDGSAAGAQQSSTASVSQQQQQQQQSLPGSQPDLLQWFVQHLLGVLVALNLLLHRQVVLEAAAAGGAWLQHGVLQPHVDWLMQAHPGGIKLHLELSLLLGTVATAVLQTVAQLYALAWPLLGPTAVMAQAAAAAVGGASWGCAAAADVLLVLLLPLVVLYVLAAHMHQLQLRCLAATWRLIRGKQKVRRFSTHHRAPAQQQQQQQQQPPPPATTILTAQQTSATAAAGAATSSGGPAAGSTPEPGDEVSVEQLIVGVLLFTPLLGLLPTTVAWYLSVCWLYGVLHVLRLLLVAVGSWMQLRPLHVLAARWKRPQLFPGQLMVLPLTAVPGSSAAAAAGAAAGVGDSTAVAAGTSSVDCMQQDWTGPPAGSGSSSSRRRAGSGRKQGHVQDSRQNVAQECVHVAYYRIFYEPMGYWDVLGQSIAQQQGLLWYVCQGVGSADQRAAEGVSWLVRWGKDVVAGRMWGLRMLSTQ